jgi:hypothetical protein
VRAVVACKVSPLRSPKTTPAAAKLPMPFHGHFIKLVSEEQCFFRIYKSWSYFCEHVCILAVVTLTQLGEMCGSQLDFGVCKLSISDARVWGCGYNLGVFFLGIINIGSSGMNSESQKPVRHSQIVCLFIEPGVPKPSLNKTMGNRPVNNRCCSTIGGIF